VTLDPDRNLLAQDTGAADVEKRPTALRRSKLAAVLAVLACVGCCAVPVLVPLGMLTTGGLAAATTGLTVVSVILFAAAVLLWVLHRRTKGRAAAHQGCGAGGCACGN
jgi:hypothetical protein